ncbi:Rox3 mediator complex subunit-domain-containing protein [Poronia punctata]|nr:Rox3 mediator complex subunit-domain-containing protein [Poronia punctata]
MAITFGIQLPGFQPLNDNLRIRYPTTIHRTVRIGAAADCNSVGGLARDLSTIPPTLELCHDYHRLRRLAHLSGAVFDFVQAYNFITELRSLSPPLLSALAIAPRSFLTARRSSPYCISDEHLRHSFRARIPCAIGHLSIPTFLPWTTITATMSFNPQTPQSPSQFSPNLTDQGSSMNTSMTSITASLPTPAHSVNGSGLPSDNQQDSTMTDAASRKRKFIYDGSETGERRKMYANDPRKIGIHDLHLDVGEKYLLCRTPHSISSPRMSEDLFEKFGLTGIAAEVARTKPNGEKNALRKTYKGQIRTLGLSGHFDVVKKDPSEFMQLLAIAEEDWQNRVVSGKGIERGLPPAVQSNLTKATHMARGQISKSVWDASVLGELAPSAGKKANMEQVQRATAPSTPAMSAAGAAQKPNKPLVSQADRARRLGKKRSYQDSSFEGYGEGFEDDAGGYSTGDGEERLSKLKRRKNPNGVVPSGKS